uniref:Immunoglobulin subtype domain-containing protein n=1 Tax=Oryzias melastigma TaxID=30732 RepID=A0A3B3BKW4_ORYME
MVNLTVVLASLCTLSLISFSLSEFQTLKVQLEGEVTLQCANFSTLIAHIIWFKLNDGPNATVISLMLTPDVNATMKNGFKDRFLMTSNITHVFLNIKNVNSSDSGLYFCGTYKDGSAVIVGGTCLQVYGKIIQKNINTFLLKALLDNK